MPFRFRPQVIKKDTQTYCKELDSFDFPMLLQKISLQKKIRAEIKMALVEARFHTKIRAKKGVKEQYNERMIKRRPLFLRVVKTAKGVPCVSKVRTYSQIWFHRVLNNAKSRFQKQRVSVVDKIYYYYQYRFFF